MKIIISGYGKIGKLLCRELSSHDLLILDPKYSKVNIVSIVDEYDLIIDFSNREAIYDICEYMKNHKNTKLIIGTTGYDEKENRLIDEIALDHVVVKDSNYSYSMHIYKKIVSYLNDFDLSSFEITLKETHNVSKRDSPSGTSYSIIKRLYRYFVEIISIRNHTKKSGVHVLEFKDKNGSICLIHEAKNRMMFVDGVIKTIDKITSLNNGLYSFEDIINGN